MTQSDELHALLRRLHEELGRARRLDEESRDLLGLVEQDIAAGWPLPEIRYDDLEVWGPDNAPARGGPPAAVRGSGGGSPRRS